MPKKTKDRLLLASVFVTGAAVLIIEITAIRILAPYYGNTIYTASSVIGIVLAALSLGYYLGGVVSDQYPHYRVFYGIIVLSGFLVFFIQILAVTLLPFFSLFFSLASGPFISSLFLFFIPAFFLGTISPFAIKLCHKALDEKNIAPGSDKVGKQSGQVFFWSTFGSIVGSLLSGFVLIPRFGIDSIIIGTGIILGLWGLAGFSCFSKNKRVSLFVVLLFLSELLFLRFYFTEVKGLVYEKDGLYEKIRIIDGVWKGRKTRFLLEDRSLASAMYLDSDELVYDYTKYYGLYKLFVPQPARALVIGGGAYSIPKALLKDVPGIKIDVTEIEPELFELSQKYFNLQETDRLANHSEDGRRFLNKQREEYDIIISDVYYSFFSIPIHFTTREFFSLVKKRLSQGGVFIGNFSGSLNKKSPSFIWSEIKTFKNVFPNSYFFAVDSPQSARPQNIIFLAVNGAKQFDFGQNFLENPLPAIADLPSKNIDTSNSNLSEYQEITDNFSPVEYLISKVISSLE